MPGEDRWKVGVGPELSMPTIAERGGTKRLQNRYERKEEKPVVRTDRPYKKWGEEKRENRGEFVRPWIDAGQIRTAEEKGKKNKKIQSQYD